MGDDKAVYSVRTQDLKY